MSTTQHKHEQRERVRAPADDLPERFLYSRKQAAKLLGGISLATLKRLEDEGILKPVRLNKRSPSGQVFYTHNNLMEVAQDEDDVGDNDGDRQRVRRRADREDERSDADA
jgi:hypothetical protein